MNTFTQKLNNIPQNAQDFLTSLKSSELNSFVCSKHGIINEDVSKFVKLISALFFKEIKVSGLIKHIKKTFNFDDKQATNLAIDIAGIRLLIIDDWIDEDVVTYISKLGGNVGVYRKYVDDQVNALKKEKEYFENELAEDEPFVIDIKPSAVDNREIDKDSEVRDSLKLFQNDLSQVLGGVDEIYLKNYNNILILLLAENSSFLSDAKRTLLSNEEKYTFKKFKINKTQTRPTISNWIKDFIATMGSGIFSNIELSKYVTNSENVKRLSMEEKRSVKKLLRLYKNLAFFPDSLKDLPPERWEIFPLDREGGEFGGMRKLSGAPKSEDEKELERLEHMEEGYAENSLERLAIDEEIEKRKKIEELRFMVNKYREDSLERKVIEEEILKLES